MNKYELSGLESKRQQEHADAQQARRAERIRKNYDSSKIEQTDHTGSDDAQDNFGPHRKPKSE